MYIILFTKVLRISQYTDKQHNKPLLLLLFITATCELPVCCIFMSYMFLSCIFSAPITPSISTKWRFGSG